jgi:hypothetical protein
MEAQTSIRVFQGKNFEKFFPKPSLRFDGSSFDLFTDGLATTAKVMAFTQTLFAANANSTIKNNEQRLRAFAGRTAPSCRGWLGPHQFGVFL